MTAGRAKLLPAVFFVAERQAHGLRPLGLPRGTSCSVPRIVPPGRIAVAAEYALVVKGARKTFRSAQRSGPWWSVRSRKTARTVKEIRAVDDISLRICKGEIYGILGSNGSGKSTLIRLVSTLLLPDAGQITVFGRDVVKQEVEVKRMINRVSVEAAFFKKLSPMENLMYAAR